MARIFISYRAADAGAEANLLAARLRDRFGLDAVFRDRNAIDLGDRFVDEIVSELGAADVVLVLLGRVWLTAADADGKRRLDEPGDLVRREVALALSLRKIVVPVLLDGAPMPVPAELPEELRGMVWLDRYDFSGKYFERDADDLARRIEVVLAKNAKPPSRDSRRTAGVIRQLLIIWIALAMVAIAFSVAPAFAPAVNNLLWLFPASMSMAAFCWWLYSLVHVPAGVQV